MKRRRCGSVAPARDSDGGGTAGVAADAVFRPPARRVRGTRKLESRRGEAEGNAQEEEENVYVHWKATSAHGSTAAEGVASEAPAGEEGDSGVECRRGLEMPGATAPVGRASRGDMATGALPASRNSVQCSGAEGKRQGNVTLDGARGSVHAAVKRRIRGKSSRTHSAEAQGACEPREKMKGDCHRGSLSTALEEGIGLRPGGSEDLLIPASSDGEKNTLKSTSTATGRPPS